MMPLTERPANEKFRKEKPCTALEGHGTAISAHEGRRSR